MVDKALQKKIEKLAKRIGPKLNWNRDPKEGSQWDTIDIACKNQTASNIIHDIAHYAVCSPLRRAFLDFGLGEGPDSKVRTKSILKGKANSKEEEKASALGIWWEKELGMNWQKTANYHSWYGGGSHYPTLEDAWSKLEMYK